MKRRLRNIFAAGARRRGVASIFALLIVMLLTGSLLGGTAAETAAEPSAGAADPHFETFAPAAYQRLGVSADMKRYDGRLLYGIYDTWHGYWKSNIDFVDHTYHTPPTPPPADAVCLRTVYDESGTLTGFEEMTHEAYMATIPVWHRGLANFDAQYGAYEAFGFARYAYDGRNVRGFWDANTGVWLAYFSPENGALLTGAKPQEAAYLQAVYDGDTLVGIEEITEAAFARIPGIIKAESECIAAHFSEAAPGA